MNTRSAIQILFLALLVTASIFIAAHAQDSLPVEKKKALHRFDPADIFPEDREATRGKRRRQKSDGSAAPVAPENSASTRLRSLNPAQPPTPTPEAAGAPANPSPASTLAPTPLSEATPSNTPTPEATPQQTAMEASGISSAVTGEDHSNSGLGFPLYFLIPMLLLVLFALIVLIIGLKKQLRTP